MLSQIERGQARPDLAFLEAAAAVLEAPYLLRPPVAPAGSGAIRARAHLVATAWSPDLVEFEAENGRPVDLGVLDAVRLCKEGDGDFADLFPFGVLAVHETHELAVDRWDELEDWGRRHRTAAAADWVAHWRGRIGAAAAALSGDLELSTFFVVEPERSYPDPGRDEAVALLCEPLDEPARLALRLARPTGQVLLSEHTRDAGRTILFAIEPNHVGWATEGNGALCDFTPGAIHARQMLRLEVQILALRALADALTRRRSPPLPGYGSTYLKRRILRLARPRPDTRRADAVLRDAAGALERPAPPGPYRPRPPGPPLVATRRLRSALPAGPRPRFSYAGRERVCREGWSASPVSCPQRQPRCLTSHPLLPNR